jgi:ATP-dependent RNA helicase DeaD
MTSKIFAELGLSAETLKAVAKMGFEQASPIQAEAIPILMAGRDIVGQSQTGSGKTAAFGIPAVEKADPNKREVQVLVLCPTRELAIQISEEIHKLAMFKRGINVLPIYGGQSYERQFFGLKQGAHIVIGTPGRVMDHMRRGTLRLETVKLAVLDEADVMLNMGFHEDIELILQAIPKERQTVFFSATMPRAIRTLIEKYAHEPQNVKIEQKAMTVPTVEQSYYEVDRRDKMELLTRLIDVFDFKLGIVFCNTKRMVDDLVDHLEAAGYMADRLHGDMTQNMRDRVMNKFRKSGLEFLVATDVAARGIDVDDVEVVFNYDLPYDPEDYVHRVGRTGRAGRSGKAISFVPGRELFQVRNIERFTNMRITRGKIPTADEVEAAREQVFAEKIRAVLVAGEFTRQERLIESLTEEGHTSADIASALIHLLHAGESGRSPNRTEEYERPDREESGDGRPERRERPGRSSYGDDRPGRSDDRGGRGSFRDRDERPARFADRPPRPDRAERAERAPLGARLISPTKPVKPASAKAVTVPIPKPETPASAPKSEAAATPAPKTEPAIESAPKPEVAAAAPPAKVEAKTEAKAEAKTEKVKTFSDAEILASVKAPAAKSESKLFIKAKPAAAAPAKPKVSRRTPEGQTRLWVGLGSEHQMTPIDFVNAVAGETGLPGKVVGLIDVRERHSFIDVATEHMNAIVSKLNRAEIKGVKVKVKAA